MTIRVPKETLASAMQWADEQEIATRSEALVRLIELGLAAPKPKAKR